MNKDSQEKEEQQVEQVLDLLVELLLPHIRKPN